LYTNSPVYLRGSSGWFIPESLLRDAASAL
jgi:hypothetical protein